MLNNKMTVDVYWKAEEIYVSMSDRMCSSCKETLQVAMFVNNIGEG